MLTIDLAATIIKAGAPYTKTFIAKELGMTWRGVQYWCKGSPIPPSKNERLIKIFTRNNIQPVWKKKKI